MLIFRYKIFLMLGLVALTSGSQAFASRISPSCIAEIKPVCRSKYTPAQLKINRHKIACVRYAQSRVSKACASEITARLSVKKHRARSNENTPPKKDLMKKPDMRMNHPGNATGKPIPEPLTPHRQHPPAGDPSAPGENPSGKKSGSDLFVSFTTLLFGSSFFVFFLILLLLYPLVWLIIEWKFSVLLGRPGWSCFMPILNIYLILERIGKPSLWFLLIFQSTIVVGVFSFAAHFLPTIGMIGMIASVFISALYWFRYNIAIAEHFHRSTLFGIGLAFPFIGLILKGVLIKHH